MTPIAWILLAIAVGEALVIGILLYDDANRSERDAEDAYPRSNYTHEL